MDRFNRYQDEIQIPDKDGYRIIKVNNLRHREDSLDQGRSIVTGYHWNSFKIRDNLQFLAMFVGMLAMLGYIGFTIGGIVGTLFTLVFIAFGFYTASNFTVEQVLRRKRVVFVDQWQGQSFYRILVKLVQKAGLEKMPALLIEETAEINAFTVEDKEKSAIVLSRGLVENLNKRELEGVMAHEIAHLMNNDIKVMLFTDQIRKLTGFIAFFGQVLLFFNLPLMLMSQQVFPWGTILVMMFAPTLSTLFQVALSRNREFRADLDAVALSNDAAGLASALKKISLQMSFWKRIYAPYRKDVPELLRTHPNTHSRIERLGQIDAERQKEYGWVG